MMDMDYYKMDDLAFEERDGCSADSGPEVPACVRVFALLFGRGDVFVEDVDGAVVEEHVEVVRVERRPLAPGDVTGRERDWEDIGALADVRDDHLFLRENSLAEAEEGQELLES